jgi:hypothetical protein
MKTGIELIAEERARQVAKEGYDAAHDDEHTDHSIARAAAAYALESAQDRAGRDVWPWEPQGFKPRDPLDDLVRAGALVAAEIDRLQRIGG